MAEVAQNKVAVVTGANKGIGFEICKQLASHGITVVLGARDEKRGLEAVEKLNELGVGDHIVFHKLDVTDATSVVALAKFIKSRFGKLDLLVNNAGIFGAEVNLEAMKAAVEAGEDLLKINWSKIVHETYESATSGFETNYFGLKKVTKALIPLFQHSRSPRIVNVASIMGMLERIPNEWAKGILNDVESLTEERIDKVVNEYLKDTKEGLVKDKGWPESGSYKVSKAAVLAYTRLLAKEYPTIKINAVCPGSVKTDLSYQNGVLTVEEGADNIVRVTLLPDDGPSGLFYDQKKVSSY